LKFKKKKKKVEKNVLHSKNGGKGSLDIFFALVILTAPTVHIAKSINGKSVYSV
jgi:hypothetical protein